MKLYPANLAYCVAIIEWNLYGYTLQDANCGNTLLISLEELVKDGLLMENELPDPL